MTDRTIPDGEVRVWWASLEASDAQIAALRPLLTPQEQQRAERFRIDAAARRFIAARAALRAVLGRVTGSDPADVIFVLGEHGKPRLADGGPCFNVSDSGDFVAITIAAAEIGIDIEVTRPLRRRDRLARRICTEGELEALARLPEDDRDRHLLRLWTCKEAALKAIGAGLRGGVRNVEIEIPARGAPKLVCLLGAPDGWTLLVPHLSTDFLCSIVVREGSWRVVSQRFSLQSM